MVRNYRTTAKVSPVDDRGRGFWRLACSMLHHCITPTYSHHLLIWFEVAKDDIQLVQMSNRTGNVLSY